MTHPAPDLDDATSAASESELASLLAGLDTGERVRGRGFERLCGWVLENAPEYVAKVERVGDAAWQNYLIVTWVSFVVTSAVLGYVTVTRRVVGPVPVLPVFQTYL